jgi:hypothetical protein
VDKHGETHSPSSRRFVRTTKEQIKGMVHLALCEDDVAAFVHRHPHPPPSRWMNGKVGQFMAR